MLGLDVSAFQPALPWAQFRAAGREFVIVRASWGTLGDPRCEMHRLGALGAGLQVGFYHALLTGDGARQARMFAQMAGQDDSLMFGLPRYWVDVEVGTSMAATLTAFLAEWSALRPSCAIGIYTGQGAWQMTIGDGHREFAHYPLWCGSWPKPDIWTTAAIQQNPVPGHLPGYAGNLDLDEIIMPTPIVPIVTHGPKLGIHSIQPGNTIPLVKQAVAAGWRWPLIKILHDASVAVDVKAISPQTLTIVRYMPPSKDDEGLQNVDQWTVGQTQAWATRLIDLIFARTPASNFAAVDYWDVTNEPGAHGVQYYKSLGLAFCELVRQADARHIHLSLPALPQGVPEYDEMVALVDTGLFGLMKAGGHIFDVHEGVFTDQPIDFGFGDIIPGAPFVAGAGSTNFRHRYLYSILEARGDVVPLVISEFYGGGRYSNPPADQVARFAWYDQRARQEPYLLAFLPFTINPDGGWAGADYGSTYASRELWDYIAAEKDLPNATGDDMADIQAALTAIRAARTQLDAAEKALTDLHTLANLTNQQVFNLFAKVFGNVALLDKLGLSAGMAAARQAGYVGPAVENMALTAEQKAALIAGL